MLSGPSHQYDLYNQQTLSGPSHQYDLYKQQTGIPSGAVATTLAVNSKNAHMAQNHYGGVNDYYSGLGTGDDFIDFGTAPRQQSNVDMDMDYTSPSAESAYFYPDHTMPSEEFVNPSVIGGQENSSIPMQGGMSAQAASGRLWPGMHQKQAAIAKAQAQAAQQKQQQAINRQQTFLGQPPMHQAPRMRAVQKSADPLVEEKISQLLNSMRHNSVATSEGDDANTPMAHAHRMRKEEEDMDEDERLLASEEGKKLSSKERRQLRNKVSARAFRSRRKGKRPSISS